MNFTINRSYCRYPWQTPEHGEQHYWQEVKYENCSFRIDAAGSIYIYDISWEGQDPNNEVKRKRLKEVLGPRAWMDITDLSDEDDED
jgi:hypothetical protein